jgi:hypothetical protein
VAAAPRRS